MRDLIKPSSGSVDVVFVHSSQGDSSLYQLGAFQKLSHTNSFFVYGEVCWLCVFFCLSFENKSADPACELLKGE